MGKVLVLPALLLGLALVAGCYGPASPKTCYAKFIRDQSGGPGDFERCLARAGRRMPADFERCLEGSEKQLPGDFERCLARLARSERQLPIIEEHRPDPIAHVAGTAQKDERQIQCADGGAECPLNDAGAGLQVDTRYPAQVAESVTVNDAGAVITSREALGESQTLVASDPAEIVAGPHQLPVRWRPDGQAPVLLDIRGENFQQLENDMYGLVDCRLLLINDDSERILLTANIMAVDVTECPAFAYARLLENDEVLISIQKSVVEIDSGDATFAVAILSESGVVSKEWSGPEPRVPSWARSPSHAGAEQAFSRAEELARAGALDARAGALDEASLDEACRLLEPFDKTFAPKTKRVRKLNKMLLNARKIIRNNNGDRVEKERKKKEIAIRQSHIIFEKKLRIAKSQIKSIVDQYRRRMEISLRACLALNDCNYAIFAAFGFGCPGCRGSYEDAVRQADQGPTMDNVVLISVNWPPLYTRQILGLPLATAEELRKYSLVVWQAKHRQ